MLGWEYPPHISGGLGTACEGLSQALAAFNVDLNFVVPRLYGDEELAGLKLTSASSFSEVSASGTTSRLPHGANIDELRKRLSNILVPGNLLPYWNPTDYQSFIESFTKLSGRKNGFTLGADVLPGTEHYSGDLFTEVNRYAERVLMLFNSGDYDIIHAHDWMTFPAGVALSKATGKPLVLHVHSLEFDRSGEHGNHQICQIEEQGLRYCNAVIAVSYYTRSLIYKRYGISLDKVSVVHNGVYTNEVRQHSRHQIGSHSKVVLFLGRVTFQKGPEYFVEAASKVIPHVPDALFVMAGSGDMLPRMVKRVRELNIQDHFMFPGFLKGQEVEEMYSAADLYVMPSVSEPFGISALEAISFDTPVILSRQSGVSEVLRHALKADFWDIDRLADLIINALLHEELRRDMVNMAREEVRRLRWEVAALKTIELYRKIIGGN